MDKLTIDELQQLLDYNSDLRSKIILNGATEKEVALIDFYSNLVLEELEKRNAVIKIHFNEVNNETYR